MNSSNEVWFAHWQYSTGVLRKFEKKRFFVQLHMAHINEEGLCEDWPCDSTLKEEGHIKKGKRRMELCENS